MSPVLALNPRQEDRLACAGIRTLHPVPSRGASPRALSPRGPPKYRMNARQATMKTDNGLRCVKSRSGGQGSGETPGPEGPTLQARRPEANEPTTSDPAEGRPTVHLGKPYATDSGVVGEASMCVLGLHGDLGRPSALPTVEMRATSRRGPGWNRARTTVEVGPTVRSERRSQGVGRGHSSHDDPGNREGAKGLRSTKGDVEKATEGTSRSRGRNDREPTLSSTVASHRRGRARAPWGRRASSGTDP